MTTLLWLGISFLYFGFAGVLGVLARKASSTQSAWLIILTILHATLLFVPASILVVGLPESSPFLQIPVLLAGVLIATLGFKQPERIPTRIWNRSFAHCYFGVAMAFATLWGISVIVTGEGLLNLPVAAATCFAGTVALRTVPRIT